MQRFLELLVLIAPEDGAHLEVGHLIGGEGASLHVVDKEALQTTVGVKVA